MKIFLSLRVLTLLGRQRPWVKTMSMEKHFWKRGKLVRSKDNVINSSKEVYKHQDEIIFVFRPFSSLTSLIRIFKKNVNKIMWLREKPVVLMLCSLWWHYCCCFQVQWKLGAGRCHSHCNINTQGTFIAKPSNCTFFLYFLLIYRKVVLESIS